MPTGLAGWYSKIVAEESCIWMRFMRRNRGLSNDKKIFQASRVLSRALVSFLNNRDVGFPL